MTFSATGCIGALGLLVALGVTLTASAEASSALERSAPSWQEMTDAIEARKYRKIEAVLVDRGGSLVYERYFGKTDAETRIDARSAGKSLTALAFGMALADGSIESVEKPLLSYFEAEEPFQHDGPMKRAITLRDVLTMSSAFDCDDWRKSPGNEERMYRTKDWTRFALDMPIDEEYRRGPRGFGRYSYCTAGVFLVGRVVERATGFAFDAFVQERLFKPLGITGAIWRKAPNGQVQSGGQLSLRGRDFMALGRLVLDRLRHNDTEKNGEALLSRTWLREMLTVHVQATPYAGYGYLWWIRNFSFQEQPYAGFYMSGNGGNKVVLFPELDAVVVILSTNYGRRNMHDQTTELIERYILPELRALETPAPASAQN